MPVFSVTTKQLLQYFILHTADGNLVAFSCNTSPSQVFMKQLICLSSSPKCMIMWNLPHFLAFFFFFNWCILVGKQISLSTKSIYKYFVGLQLKIVFCNNINEATYTNISACVSFTSTLLIVDPTAEEEDLATGTVTIVTDEEGRLCSVHKPGTCKSTTKKPMEMTILGQEKIM